MNSALTLRQLLTEAVAHLPDADTDSARLDAEVLLCHLLGCNRAHLRAWPERELDAGQTAAYRDLIARRADGEPVAYLTGRREFWSLDLRVTPATLIPRPDTETLVEQALAFIPADAQWAVADLGTGSGAIALALALERPHCRVVATDLSAAALEVARDNAARHRIGNAEFRLGPWFAPLAGERFQLIVSNPPYVRADDPHLGHGDVRFEPLSALTSGTDGLDAIRQLVAGAAHHLAPGGRLLLEHGYDQAAAVRELLQNHGYTDVMGWRDGAGVERVSGARLD